MDRRRRQRNALRLGAAAGLVVLVGATWLIADHVAAARRAPAEKDRVEQLRERVKTDAGAAEVLHAERDRQTNVSLRRKSRNRVLAWILLAAGGVSVACGKRYMSLEPLRSPSLDDLVAQRFAPPSPADRKPQTTSPGATGDGDDAVDLSFVERLVARFGTGREAAIPILQEIQSHYRYLPDEALRRLCELTEITPAQVLGTSSFYARFRRSPVGRHVVRVCHGTACHVAGAEHITDELRRHLEIPSGSDTDARRSFTLDRVACVGCCSLAPVMMIEGETAGRLTPASARQALEALEPRT